MSGELNRRRFVQRAAAGGTLLGLGDFAFLRNLPPVSAADAGVNTKMVQLSPDIEPLVHLLETTPRDQLLESVAAKIKSGTSYQEVLAALLLAAVRNVEPRPSVGFKFHAVLVVNSAHLASLSSPETDRWLPIFWALDYFKAKQIEEEQRSGWKLPPVDESAVPPARKAREAFTLAMDNWDEPAADAAIASLARNAGAAQMFELLYRYGCRDFRSIGHKAIFVANCQRSLGCIGWRHAEPVLRSLVYAMLNHRRDPNPAESDLEADRPGRVNAERLLQIRDGWESGTIDDKAARELLVTMRNGTSDETCALAVELLNRGTSPQSIWDALLSASGELLIRQPGIVALHSLTTANALYHAYQATGSDETRRYILLQNCAFVPMFRGDADRRGTLNDLTLEDLKSAELSDPTSPSVIEEIFADVNRDDLAAAGKVRAWLNAGGNAESIIDAARRLIFLKGRDAHDYKFSSAVLEDYYHVSPQWRGTYLAASMFQLRGSGDRDNGLVERTRAALA